MILGKIWYYLKYLKKNIKKKIKIDGPVDNFWVNLSKIEIF